MANGTWVKHRERSGGLCHASCGSRKCKGHEGGSGDLVRSEWDMTLTLGLRGKATSPTGKLLRSKSHCATPQSRTPCCPVTHRCPAPSKGLASKPAFHWGDDSQGPPVGLGGEGLLLKDSETCCTQSG